MLEGAKHSSFTQNVLAQYLRQEENGFESDYVSFRLEQLIDVLLRAESICPQSTLVSILCVMAFRVMPICFMPFRVTPFCVMPICVMALALCLFALCLFALCLFALCLNVCVMPFCIMPFTTQCVFLHFD